MKLEMEVQIGNRGAKEGLAVKSHSSLHAQWFKATPWRKICSPSSSGAKNHPRMII